MSMPDGEQQGFSSVPGLPPEVVAALQTDFANRLLAAAAKQEQAEPLGAMDSIAIVLHTWFDALVRAGFTDEQAIRYLALKS